MTRTARCHCGDLSIRAEGEPVQVILCHCASCQRTGTSFNLAAWFETSRLSPSGATQTYTRSGDQGISTTYYFCPRCGSNVYWAVPSVFPDMLGVAVGCFADPAFPAPTLALYGARRHHWLQAPAGTPCLSGGLGSPPE